MKSILILIAFIAFWIAYAVKSERKAQENAYSAAKKRDEDSISSSLRKIRYCVTYDLRTIKWRRSLISAGIVTVLLFALVWRRMPSSTELLTHILLITAVFSAMWSSYTARTSSDVASYVGAHIGHIKELLTKNHSFILPSWI